MADHLKRIIENTYLLDTVGVEIGQFIVGDEGYRLLYGGRPITTVLKRQGSPEARLLIRKSHQGYRVRIYFPDRMIEKLEKHHPTTELNDENIDEFAALVEEIDHFLLFVQRCRQRRTVTLYEMELHANITKYLTAKLFLARLQGGSSIAPSARQWLLHHLFWKHTFADSRDTVTGRYEDAKRYALQYIRYVETVRPSDRVTDLRIFSAQTAQGKTRHIVQKGQKACM